MNLHNHAAQWYVYASIVHITLIIVNNYCIFPHNAV